MNMKSCILDGSALPDAAAIYRELGAAFDAPAYFGANPDALWDAITEYSGEPVEIVWRHLGQSAARLGPAFERIVEVLKGAEEQGRIKLSLV
jgi:RNAse (barnase) inhibitor barstar